MTGTASLNYIVNQQVLGERFPADFEDTDIDTDYESFPFAEAYVFQTTEEHAIGHPSISALGNSANLAVAVKCVKKGQTNYFSTTSAGPALVKWHLVDSSSPSDLFALVIAEPEQGFHQWCKGPSDFERMLAELGRLQNGWAGPGSVAPPAQVLRDVERVFSALDRGVVAPQFEIDPDDGSVTMFWQRGSAAFSLISTGNGAISGVLSPYQASYEPWTVPADKTETIARKLQSDSVQALIKNA